MKKFRLFIVISLVLAIMTCFVGSSCRYSGNNKPALDTPDGFEVDSDTLELTWGAVENAQRYKIQVDEENASKNGDYEPITSETRTPTYDLSKLSAGEYSVKIKAVGAKGYSDSAWGVYKYTREQESGMNFELSDDETTWRVTGSGKESGELVVPSVYRGKLVTAVADYAFSGDSSVTKITLPSSILTIGECSFEGCENLTEIVLSDGIDSLGNECFKNCVALTTISIPESLEEIPYRAFAGCTSLKSIVIGKSVTEIGRYAFSGCSALTSITFNDLLTSTGQYAFFQCTALEEVTFPSNIKTIDESTFRGCTKLKTINFSDGLEEIASYAFYKCPSIESVVIPDSVTSIGKGAFYDCTSLTDITLSKNLTYMGEGAFNSTAVANAAQSSGEKQFYVGKWLVTNFDTTGESVEIKDDTIGIASYAFTQSKLFSVVIPASVKYVNNYAFYKNENLVAAEFLATEYIGYGAMYKCSKLQIVTLGEGLKEISTWAFGNCSALTDVNIPSTVTSIGGYAFEATGIWDQTEEGMVYIDDWAVGMKSNVNYLSLKAGTKGVADYGFMYAEKVDQDGDGVVDTVKYNSALIGVTFAPNDTSLKYLGASAFTMCISLVTITIPDSITEIREYTFYGCVSLLNVVLPDTITQIGRSAFYDCEALKSVNLPEGLTEIADYTFLQCYALTSVKIPSTVTRIGDYAFYGCTALVSLEADSNKLTDDANLYTLVLPDGVTEIGEFAFCGTPFKHIEFPAALTKISRSAFYAVSDLEEVVLPDTVKEIDRYAFYGCTSLKSVTMNNVTSIGRSAFYGCASLTDLVLPSTLEEIGIFAFKDCVSLKTVIIPQSVTSVGRQAFLCGDYLTVYLEAASVPEGWMSDWNLRFRPVVCGCTLDSTGTYVVSFTTSDNSVIVHKDCVNFSIAPYRAGYTFEGWSVGSGDTQKTISADSVDEFLSVEKGTTFTAKWTAAA